MADDYATIRVPKEAFDEAKRRKDELNMTWGEYVTDESRGGPDPESVATELTARLNLDADPAKDEIEGMKQQVEEVQQMLEDTQESWKYLNGEEIHGTMHQADEITKKIIGRIDDLETRLPSKIEEELR